MSKGAKYKLVTVEEYLAAESISPFKHEYVDGAVYPWGNYIGTTRKHKRMTVEEYLANELTSPIKNEYQEDTAYSMVDERAEHNAIATNTAWVLYSRLRDRPFRPFNSDMKLRVRFPTHVRFYYPDVSVVCRSNPPSDLFQDEPVVVFEVVSEQTRRTDQDEKKEAYLTIPSLAVYGVIEQETAAIVVYRRSRNNFVREEHEGMEAVLDLSELGIVVPLAEIYENVVFTEEPKEDLL